jgi:LEA14-like dessication related protein
MRLIGILLVAIAACVAAAAVGCSTPSTELVGRPAAPAVRFSAARFENVGTASATVVFDLSVSNPNSEPLALAGAQYRLTVADRPVAEGRMDLDSTVPAHDSVTVGLPIKFEYARIISVAAGARMGSVVPYHADLTLAVNAPLAGQPPLRIAVNGNLPIPAAPELRGLDARWDTLSPDRVSGVVTVTLANPNRFPFTLVSLSYKLTVSGATIARGTLERPASFNADGGTATVEIPVSILPRNLGAAVADLVEGRNVEFKLEGEVTVSTPFGTMTLPIGAEAPR